MSLNGLRVLNTRPLHQAQALNEQIRLAGGCALSCPTIAITASHSKWVEELPDLADVKQAIFTSANAVNYFFDELKHRQITWPTSIHIIAIGEGTRSALLSYDKKVDSLPIESHSEGIVNLPTLQAVADQSILLIKGKDGRNVIRQTLLKRKAHIIELAVYERTLPIVNQEKLLNWWKDDHIDIILFTSQAAMENLFSLFDPQTHAWLKQKPCLVISERLIGIAQQLGMQKIIQCPFKDIIETLQGLVHDANI